MKTLEDIRKQLLQNKKYLKDNYHVKQIGIFGSYVYGKPTKKSDIDILVDFSKPIGLDFVTLADELELILGSSVDLVSLNALRPEMKKQILKYILYV